MIPTASPGVDVLLAQTNARDGGNSPRPASVSSDGDALPAVPAAGQEIRPTSDKPGAPIDWDQFFAAKQRDPLDIRKLVFQLHEAKQHSEVANVIRAALRNGQGQPWMYEVLVITLKIEGAPQAEIERAILSQIDFAATDANSLMMSAAYLTRFEATTPALRLYRQASDLSPGRPEPYLLGLKLAQREKDDDALIWAVRGIFTAAWGKNHAQHHQQAANAIADRARTLRAANQPEAASKLEQALQEARQVDLDVRLEWSGDGDLDLVIHEPQGTICSFENERTPGGGVLAHDGYGPRQNNCYEHYICAAGFPGIYRIHVRHRRGDIVGKRAKLIIRQNLGSESESRQEIVVPITDEGESIRVPLMNGRREAFLNIPDENAEPVKAAPATSLRRPGPARDGQERQALARFRDSSFRQVGGSPVVGGVTPVGGFGAVGYQPNVVVIPSGAMLHTQAVVSPDRRYVRLSVSPQFTQLIDVVPFQFNSSP